MIFQETEKGGVEGRKVRRCPEKLKEEWVEWGLYRREYWKKWLKYHLVGQAKCEKK